jgi:hypothetical protein
MTSNSEQADSAAPLISVTPLQTKCRDLRKTRKQKLNIQRLACSLSGVMVIWIDYSPQEKSHRHTILPCPMQCMHAHDSHHFRFLSFYSPSDEPNDPNEPTGANVKYETTNSSTDRPAINDLLNLAYSITLYLHIFFIKLTFIHELCSYDPIWVNWHEAKFPEADIFSSKSERLSLDLGAFLPLIWEIEGEAKTTNYSDEPSRHHVHGK